MVHIDVPLYKGLAKDEFIDIILKDGQVGAYFPDERDIHKLNREWICNGKSIHSVTGPVVLNTIYKEQFTNYVKEKVKERHESVLVKKNLAVELIPEAKKAFEETQQVAVSIAVLLIL